ncbi:acyl-CoA thioesterase [Pseudooceanicola aestuarii]|uniref:acyl-CoA thioesterase n=1 Tax=Pseudooceanicola aestuarii TaxID=2697319 RepID=UPI0013D4C538|nr:acyl-CoA thioesterase [Pseudooceanicola aestuarii]
MYPFVRMAKEIIKFRKAPPLGVDGVHVSHHRIWPWDLDFMMELNNGRTLSIYDLGRIPFALRAGLFRVLRQNGWGLTVAGSVLRYRRRMTVFERVEMQSRLLGWDARFVYIEQSMWKDGTCASHGIFRTAVTGKGRMVPTEAVLQALGLTDTSPSLPDWVAALFMADDSRPWPPTRV